MSYQWEYEARRKKKKIKRNKNYTEKVMARGHDRNRVGKKKKNQCMTVIWLPGKIPTIAAACVSELCASLSFQHLLSWLLPQVVRPSFELQSSLDIDPCIHPWWSLDDPSHQSGVQKGLKLEREGWWGGGGGRKWRNKSNKRENGVWKPRAK